MAHAEAVTVGNGSMRISDLFLEFGSDKSHPTGHSYGEFYDDLVSSMPITSILEVGVEVGYSMAAWKKLLPEAIIIGLDKDVSPQDSISKLDTLSQRNINKSASRTMLRHGEVALPYHRLPGLDVRQCCVPDFSAVIDRFRNDSIKFDLIIDDASHAEDHQVATYHYLKEFLSPSGVFVIEDLQNEEVIKRFRNSGWEIIDLRGVKDQWDDVIAVFYAKGKAGV